MRQAKEEKGRFLELGDKFLSCCLVSGGNCKKHKGPPAGIPILPVKKRPDIEMCPKRAVSDKSLKTHTRGDVPVKLQAGRVTDVHTPSHLGPPGRASPRDAPQARRPGQSLAAAQALPVTGRYVSSLTPHRNGRQLPVEPALHTQARSPTPHFT